MPGRDGMEAAVEWIDVKGLEEWANHLDARSHLMKMLVDLINATASDPQRLRFPHGEASQVRGWDGDLEAPVAAGRVPAGKSKWEFGTGAAESKANADYKKRTKQTPAKDMAENTLVIVNLTTWDTPKKKISEWEDDRNKEGKWKAVRCIDGVELAHWLDDHPAIAARYARDVLLKAPKEGAVSTDEYWEEFRAQFDPPLHEKLVIAGRQTDADEIISQLSGPAGPIFLGAETSEEVIAFAVAAIRSAPQATREYLEARTLVLRNEPAARFFSLRRNMCFLVTGDAEPKAGELANNCPTLSAVTGPAARRHRILRRPTASGMAEGFKEMGIEHRDGYELAHRCGRSLTILKRLKYRVRPKNPDWLHMVETLKPAFLAGGWSRDLEKDRQVLAELAEVPLYRDLERELIKTLGMSDRPIDQEQEIWQVRAPVDAFFFYQDQLTEEDFDRLSDAVIKVFSHEPEKPTREQKFNLANSDPTGYSSWLRDGLATTLLILAAMPGEDVRKIRGQTVQQYIERMLQALPGWGKSYASIVRLGEQVALIAEAAPSPFLSALESILEGDAESILKDPTEQADDPFDRGSYAHHDLLWALETLAWDPRYVMRATLLLAKLAALDPDPNSNFVTRPINSLREIFVAWSPSTYAPQAKRIASIDAILAAQPEIGWDLLCKLLPRHHDSASPTRKPKLSDQSPENPEEISFGLVWDFQGAIISRAVDLAQGCEGRLATLVGSLGQMQPVDHKKIIQAVDRFLEENQTELGVELWHKLNDELARNLYFAGAKWVMRDDSLEQLQDLVHRHRPSSPIATDRLAFDDWTPMIGRYDRDAGVNPEEVRRQTLQKVFDRDGIEGIVALAKIVKLPALVASTVPGLKLSLEDLFALLETAKSDSAVPGEISHYVSAYGARVYGDEWLSGFIARLPDLTGSDGQTVKMLDAFPATRATWEFVDALGPTIRDLYWQSASSLPFEGSAEDLVYAISRFRAAGRSIDVLPLLHRRADEVPTELLQQLLTDSRSQIDQGFKRNGNMLTFHLAKSLTELRGREGVDPKAVAMLEYAFFPLVHSESNELTLFRLLAREPSLFVELLSKIYRRKDAAPDEEISDEVRNEARAAFRVLHEFKELPGLDGDVVSEEVLLNWALEVKTRSQIAGIEDVAERRIGALLVHSPNEPERGTWPADAVCRVIEQLASDQLGSGFEVECFNKRGVHSRSVNEGGDQERKLAALYQGWSDALPHFPRVCAMLASVAENWRDYARREDIEAEQGKMKM